MSAPPVRYLPVYPKSPPSRPSAAEGAGADAEDEGYKGGKANEEAWKSDSAIVDGGACAGARRKSSRKSGGGGACGSGCWCAPAAEAGPGSGASGARGACPGPAGAVWRWNLTKVQRHLRAAHLAADMD